MFKMMITIIFLSCLNLNAVNPAPLGSDQQSQLILPTPPTSSKPPKLSKSSHAQQDKSLDYVLVKHGKPGFCWTVEVPVKLSKKK